jgi:DNA-binding XRE family transcriptional regulator
MATNSKSKRGAASLADRFAVNLKSERLRRKLSQESLAKALAVAPTSLLS